jgi:uncharacterized protein (TIGR03066 family)
MRFALLIGIGLCFLGSALAVAQDAAATKLVGTWFLTKGKAPNLTLTFTKDGKLAVTTEVSGKTVKSDGTYTLKNNELSSRLVHEGQTLVEVHKIKRLTDTELHTEDKDGLIDEFKKK